MNFRMFLLHHIVPMFVFHNMISLYVKKFLWFASLPSYPRKIYIEKKLPHLSYVTCEKLPKKYFNSFSLISFPLWGMEKWIFLAKIKFVHDSAWAWRSKDEFRPLQCISIHSVSCRACTAGRIWKRICPCLKENLKIK